MGGEIRSEAFPVSESCIQLLTGAALVSEQAHEACGPMEIDSALNTVQTLKNELQDAKMAAVDGQLKPLPGETVIEEGCSSFKNKQS